MKRLHGLGYAQELFRVMGGFSNFAISFTIISVLSGCVTLFYITEINGGYSAASLGWPIVTIFVVIVALGMAGDGRHGARRADLPSLVFVDVVGLPGDGIPAGST